MNTKTCHTGLFALTLLTSLLLIFTGQAVAAAGKFQFVNGEVRVIDAAGNARSAVKGNAVEAGETISSASNGFAQIKMEDGGFFAVRPDTEFKIDVFKYEGKDDGSEKGIFSLVKGSLRAVTGIVGKKHKENYKISTVTATIGVRGSGADVGHSDQMGTAVRTLFGGYTLTSNGRTINVGPGLSALAPPGTPPRIVPSFPFSTALSAGTNNSGDAKGEQTASEDKGTNASGKGNASANDKNVVIAITSTDGLDLTNLKLSGLNGPSFLPDLADGYGFEVLSDDANPYSTLQPAASFTFDKQENLIGFKTSQSAYKVSGGVAYDGVCQAGAFCLGRWQGATVAGGGSTTNLGADSLHWIVSTNPLSGMVQSLQGVSSYALFAKTNPTDMHGNLGQLASISKITADFTNRLVDVDLFVKFQAGNPDYVSNRNTNFEVHTAGIPIYNNQAWRSSSDTVTCTGDECSGNYKADLWSQFAGLKADYNSLAYTIKSSKDAVNGVASFKLTNAADALGGGGAAVGYLGLGDSDVFNAFNVVDNKQYYASVDHDGNLLSWLKITTLDTILNTHLDRSFTAKAATRDGADAANGVVWGRWTEGYTVATSQAETSNKVQMPATRQLSFVTGTHITTAQELGALSISASYSLAPGNFPTVVNGAPSGSINSATATVNFGSQMMTSLNVSGGGGAGGFGNWSVSGKPASISSFKNDGLILSGTGESSSISGTAVGAFVGNKAQGLISTIGLQQGSNRLGGAIYMKQRVSDH